MAGWDLQPLPWMARSVPYPQRGSPQLERYDDDPYAPRSAGLTAAALRARAASTHARALGCAYELSPGDGLGRAGRLPPHGAPLRATAALTPARLVYPPYSSGSGARGSPGRWHEGGRPEAFDGSGSRFALAESSSQELQSERAAYAREAAHYGYAGAYAGGMVPYARRGRDEEEEGRILLLERALEQLGASPDAAARSASRAKAAASLPSLANLFRLRFDPPFAVRAAASLFAQRWRARTVYAALCEPRGALPLRACHWRGRRLADATARWRRRARVLSGGGRLGRMAGKRAHEAAADLALAGWIRAARLRRARDLVEHSVSRPPFAAAALATGAGADARTLALLLARSRALRKWSTLATAAHRARATAVHAIAAARSRAMGRWSNRASDALSLSRLLKGSAAINPRRRAALRRMRSEAFKNRALSEALQAGRATRLRRGLFTLADAPPVLKETRERRLNAARAQVHLFPFRTPAIF
ncbi:hypothetical protein T492DRAFT_1133378 [Pavlovales sp. CCMP2436]|nr:hypothetical protein T492DRAFT_1133378 [Pavlovales sp. CCMP2436]